MNFCPYCDYDEVISLGVAGDGWAFYCEACGAEWTETDRWVDV